MCNRLFLQLYQLQADFQQLVDTGVVGVQSYTRPVTAFHGELALAAVMLAEVCCSNGAKERADAFDWFAVRGGDKEEEDKRSVRVLYS